MPISFYDISEIQSIMSSFRGGENPLAIFKNLLDIARNILGDTSGMSDSGEKYSSPRSGSLETIIGGTTGGGANVGVNSGDNVNITADTSSVYLNQNTQISPDDVSSKGLVCDCAIYVKPGDEPKIYGHTVAEIDNSSGFGDNTVNVVVPHIIINNVKILPEHIHEMYIDLKGFIPEGWVIVQEGTQTDIPGEKNHITIITSPVHSNSNRKIWIPGYITQGLRQREGRYSDPSIKYVKYTFRASYEGLEQSKSSMDGVYRTYDYIRKIALDSGLGFASSAGVEEITDARLRWSSGNTGYRLLRNEIDCGGLGSEKTVLKGWIDAYGYVNLVNIYHQLHNIDNVSELNVDIGPHVTSVNLPSSGLRTVKSYPVITNLDMQEQSNNHILDYRWKINHFDTANYGNSMSVIILTPDLNTDPSVSVGPLVRTIDIQVGGIELGADPNSAEKKWPAKYLGEQQTDLPLMLLKEISLFYDRKLNLTQFEVTMERPNYDLLRGTQVKVFIVEKNNLQANRLDPDISRTLNDLGEPVVNPQNTFVGYINGMEFYYNSFEQQTIQQKLFLIPITPVVPLASITSIPSDKGYADVYVKIEGSSPTQGTTAVEDQTSKIDPET